MKLLILFLITSAYCSALFAEEVNHCLNAVQRHISEAIVHNRKMAPIYSELSFGKSVKLSRYLILGERASVLLMKNIERQSKLYQEKGIPLLCEEIPDMKTLPLFQERLPLETRPVDFFNYDQKKIAAQIKVLMSDEQYDLAYEAIANDLRKLEEHPNQLCLTRHFLESIARTLLLSSNHREKAKRLGLPDPKKIIEKFIALQRRALPLTYSLDKQAFGLQKEGLLIFCQDVPAISWK